MVNQFNRKHKILEFPLGSAVMTKEMDSTNNLAPLYHGPYTIHERTERGAYKLLDLTGQIVPRDFAPEQLKAVSSSPSSVDQSYEVQCILGHTVAPGGEVRYLVKWKGYEDKDNSEIQIEDFDSDLIVRDYWKKLGAAYPHNVQKRKERALRASKKRARIEAHISNPDQE
ncbi:hypothetical protein BGZ94_005325, partial [Podila epigama]